MAKYKSHKIGNFISKIVVYGFITIFSIAAITNVISKLFNDDLDNTNLADGFTIEAYDVTLNVNVDNKVDVIETITTNFTSCYKHGIYRFIPEWYEYTGKDGKTIKRKSVISNYQAIGDPYSLDTIKKKARIKIGSASEYVGCGTKTYTVHYTYDMGKDPFKNFDELIFHAYGDYWKTEIKNATIHINMPKSIEGYNVNFFMDKYRKEDATDFVDYTISGNKLTAKFNQEKYKQYQIEEYCSNSYHNVDGVCDFDENSWYGGKYINTLDTSLTVDIQLPEGYFVGGSWNYGWGSFLIIMLIFALTAWIIYKWLKYGKDHEKKIQTVEFYPPDNLNAAEIGYVFNKHQASKKYTIALIIQLASKGYIKIDDLKDKDKNIQITNLIPNPHKPNNFDKTLLKREIEVKKIKDSDEKISKAEATMMKYLFRDGDIKKLKSNIDKFLEVRDSLVEKGYIEVLCDNEQERNKDIDKKKKEYDKLVAQYNDDVKKQVEFTSKLQSLSNMERIVYDRLFESKDVIVLSEHKTFYKAFDDIESQLKNTFKYEIHDKKATKQMHNAILIDIVIIILNLISYCLVEDLDPSWNILYLLAFACIFINLFFVIFMKRKTEYGEAITAKVKGFRDFLITVEKPKLEALVSENPHYFYNILPYTYVMNISKKWIKKFENIPVLEMDMGNFNYGSDSSYYSLYNDIYYPESVHSSSGGSSGCSSCGGGCSSCGGGCSSCGGGGSW